MCVCVCVCVCEARPLWQLHSLLCAVVWWCGGANDKGLLTVFMLVNFPCVIVEVLHILVQHCVSLCVSVCVRVSVCLGITAS